MTEAPPANTHIEIPLCRIVEEAGAHVVGIGIVISKDFQGGKKSLEDKGYRVETLASVAKMDNGIITFA